VGTKLGTVLGMFWSVQPSTPVPDSATGLSRKMPDANRCDAEGLSERSERVNECNGELRHYWKTR
jgi:hypothetical protein